MSKKTREDRKDIPQEILDTAHRVWLAGLGALASAEEEGNRMFRQLVERGREIEGRGREGVREAGDRMRSRAEGVGEVLDARVTGVLHRMGVPTRDEIAELTRRVEELNTKVERARSTPATPASSPVTPAPTPASTPLPDASGLPGSSGGGTGKP